MENFSHLNKSGNATMVDVSGKHNTLRFASASATLEFPPEIVGTLQAGNMQTHKGSILQIAIIAGIMAAKRTAELIPLCHPIGLDDCSINMEFNEAKELVIICKTSVEGKTGVEMEALTGATIAALTVYDMCKSMSHHIKIKEILLLKKTGGKNDFEIDSNG